MKASEVMVADPHVAVAGAMASEVAIMFKTRNISVVPVVDDHRTRRDDGPFANSYARQDERPPSDDHVVLDDDRLLHRCVVG